MMPKTLKAALVVLFTAPLGLQAAEARGECSCNEANGKLVWKCRTVFFARPGDIGAEQTWEWVKDGDAFTVWRIAPDGTRTEQSSIRRPD
jgi:hypothetical protein